MEQLCYVKLNNICAGVVVVNGAITEAAPIFQKFVGASLVTFKNWVERKGGTVQPLPLR
jgi:hypothetical protein